MFSKSYIILPLEHILDYIGLNYCLLHAICFTYAKENLSVTSLHNKRPTAPNITAQLNQYSNKNCQHPLWGEDIMKLAYMAELLPRNYCLGGKTMSKCSSGPTHAKTGWESSGIKSFELTNQSSKSLDQIRGSMCGEEFMKELQPPVSHHS